MGEEYRLRACENVTTREQEEGNGEKQKMNVKICTPDQILFQSTRQDWNWRGMSSLCGRGKMHTEFWLGNMKEKN
jgi:hypothetical protein